MSTASAPDEAGKDHLPENLIIDLKDSGQLLSNLIQFYPDAMLIIDNDGRVVAWNKAMEEMTGVRADDMIGKGDYEYALPFYRERRPLLLNLFEQSATIHELYTDVTVRHGNLEATSLRAKIKDDNVILWGMAARLYDAKGNKIGAIETVRDVTLQKRAEEARHESERRLAEIIDFLPDATFAIDREGTVVAWNRAIEAMTGVGARDMLGQKDYAYAMPFYRARRPILIDLAFRFDEAIEKHYSYVNREGNALLAETEVCLNGKRRVLWGKAVPLYDRSGNLAGAIESIRDITERKRTEEELKGHRDRLEELVGERTADLRQVNAALQQEVVERNLAESELRHSEQFLTNIFDCIQDGISIFDQDLNILRVNHTIEERFPHARPIVGKKCYAAYHGRSEPCEHCPCIAAINRKAPQHGVSPFHGPHGAFLGWIELYAFPLFDDEGNVAGVIEHSRDITDRKRSEEALANAKAQAELYLDVMCHDINNMNQIGIGFLELMLGNPKLDEYGRSLLVKPLSALESSSRLIDNVRKIQRVKSGELTKHEMDVGQVLADVKAYYSHVPGRSVAINYTPVSGCRVMANELLYDVFSNLVGNAIKHASRAPIINIMVEGESVDGKAYHKIAIEDNGPGISDELKPRIFDRQLRGSTKAKGSGIGLYLVRTLVESYGGLAWVEDRVPGQREEGSRFIVLLPVCL